MKPLLAIAVREVWAWRGLGWAGLTLAVVALTAPWWPGLGGQSAGDVRSATAALCAAALVVGAAVVVGATVFGRDLAERRLGFYLSLPVPASTIAAGKLLGALIAVYAAAILVIAPTWLLDGPPPLDAPAVPILLAPAALLLVAHWWALALRVRSPWLALDLLAPPVAALAGWGVGSHLAMMGADRAAAFGGVVFAVPAIAGLVAAPLVQLARGRALARPAHAWQALVAGGGLCLAAAGVLGWQAWLRSGTAADIERLGAVVVAPEGEWIAVAGSLEGRLDYAPAFLSHPGSGVSLPLGPARPAWWALPHRLVFAPDGASALWRRDLPGGRGQAELVETRLIDGRVSTRDTGIEVPTSAELVYDGDRVAVWTGRGVTVTRLADGATLAAARVPGPEVRPFAWFDGAVLRLQRTTLAVDAGGAALHTIALPLAGGPPRVDPPIPLPGDLEWRSVDPEHGRMVAGCSASSCGERWAALFDLREGRLVAPLPALAAPGAAFLTDGRFLLAPRAGDGGPAIALHGPGGERLATIGGLPGRPSVAAPGAPWAPGRLPIFTKARNATGRLVRTLVEIDVESSTWRPVAEGLVEVSGPGGLSPRPFSMATRTFFDPAGNLVRLDPATGERTVLLAVDAAFPSTDRSETKEAP